MIMHRNWNVPAKMSISLVPLRDSAVPTQSFWVVNHLPVARQLKKQINDNIRPQKSKQFSPALRNVSLTIRSLIWIMLQTRENYSCEKILVP